MNGPDFSVLISLKDRLLGPLKNIRQQAESFEKRGIKPKIELQGQGQFMSSLRGMRSAILASGVVAAMALGTKAIFEQTSALEQNRVAFQVMLQDINKGNQMVAKIQEMAAITPFDSQGLQDNARLLLNFGVEADKLLPTLKMLGDVSGGNQARFDGLSLAFAQVASTGRLMGQDLLQMINAGFNPLKIISEETGRSMRELKAEMEKGNISFELVENAFKKVTEEGGQFYQMMDKQSQTLGGRFSTLRDNFNLFLTDIGEKASPLFMGFIDTASAGMDFFRQNWDNLRAVFRPLMEAVQPLVDVFSEVAAEMGLTGSAGDVLTRVFNVLGNILEFISPMLKAIASLAAEVFRAFVNVGKALFGWVADSNLISGFARAFVTAFQAIANSAKNILGGVADLVTGIFNFDLDSIKSGLRKLGEGLFTNAGMDTARSFAQGYRDGFGSTEFFWGADKKEKALTPEDLKAGASTNMSDLLNKSKGEADKAKLSRSLSSVTGDARSSRNITVNITKLIEHVEFKVTNSIKESERDMTAMLTETLLRSLRDFEASAG